MAILASLTAQAADWRSRSTLLHDILVVTWSLNALNWTVLGRGLVWFGIRPRTAIGLLGVLFSPLLHGNLPHLFCNALGFFVLGWLLLLRGTTHFWAVTGLSLLASGLGVWLFGRGQTYRFGPDQIYSIEIVHLGASGVIFGYLGFLLFAGLFERNPLSLLLSITVGVFYWNLLPGIFPKAVGISWEAHLFGFLGGVLAARFLPSILPPVY
ncbi:MAG: rhomboid family intramembrane serine protease [Elainella sp.]